MTRHTGHQPISWKRLPLAQLGTACRYVMAVPFLAAGALLLTIGALNAGTSAGRRKSGRPQRDPDCALEPKA